MKDGLILPGSKRGRVFGFTSERFEGYLWKCGDRILISLIISLQRGQGHFRELVGNIHAQGYTVAVPCPMADMRLILIRNGYRMETEFDKPTEDYVEVWVLEPPKKPVDPL
jgi:hypothetical protein